jgi:predicted aspartyl protease
MKHTTILLVVAACTHSRAPAPAAPQSAARCSTDDWSQVAFLELRGTLSVSGLTGQITTVEDVRDGRVRTDYTLGPVAGGEGYDGKVRWHRDPGGEVAIADAAEALALARTEEWLTRRGYCRDAGATYKPLGTREAGGKRYTVIEAVPDGGAKVELWLAPATRLLARTVHRDGQDTVTTSYDDYRATNGVRVPFKVTQDSGDPRNLTTITLTAVELHATVAAERFAAPGTAQTATFANGAHQTELPFDLLNNHIFISAQVDGKPIRVLVDTGGVNVLTQAAMTKLGLRSEGKLAGRGTGDEQVDVSLARPKALAIGELRVREPVFYIFDMTGFDDIEGADFDGIVGFELFHRYVVRIDYQAKKLVLAEPGTLSPPAAAIKVPFVLSGRMPLVDGTIDGTPARMTIDTGARNSITANGPFTAKHGLVARYKPTFETITGWGVGGPVKASPVRFREVTLGAAKLRDVAGDLFTGTKGAHADPDSDANVGGGILHRYVVTFDYANRVMYLEPIPNLPATDSYDRAGMFIRRAGDAIEVLATTPKGPADRAGVRTGDRIVAIDGAPIAKGSLPEWRRRFREDRPGTKLKLTLDRGGKRTAATLVLADQI